jgi:2-oxoglutarate/2-oxoacid ferredoxin oxidoreductase subunit alpha
MEKKFMKGNEAIAEAAVRAGCRFFAGYPITPQSEIPEYLAKRLPEVGGVFVQGESEIASINMVIGAAAAGVRALTSSSSPGISLKTEGISTLAGSRLPAVIIDVARTGAGTGQIYPGQNQYNVATKAPGHGGFKVIALAPATVQEAVDLTYKAFDYADRDRNPVMILADGVIGGMMEAVVLPEAKTELPDKTDWAITGCKDREFRVNASLDNDTVRLEQFQRDCAAMYERWQKEDTQYEMYLTEDAEFIIAAYGTSARVAKTVIRELRKEGIKIGLLRPITVSPFPYEAFELLDYSKVKHILCVEMCIPQLMVEDVKSAVARRIPVSSYGRGAGFVMSPSEVKDVVMDLLEKGGVQRG